MRENKYIEAYNIIMEHLHEDLGDASRTLARALDAAREKASEIGGLTQEEIHKISDYVTRDIEDAAHFLAENKNESLTEWLKFDIEMIEDFALDAFMGLADKTRLELAKLEQMAKESVIYKTGEVTGPGRLICNNCDETMNLTSTSVIPKCPKCNGKTFRRC